MVSRLRSVRVGLTARVFIALIAALIGLVLVGNAAAGAATFAHSASVTYAYDGPVNRPGFRGGL